MCRTSERLNKTKSQGAISFTKFTRCRKCLTCFILVPADLRLRLKQSVAVSGLEGFSEQDVVVLCRCVVKLSLTTHLHRAPYVS